MLRGQVLLSIMNCVTPDMTSVMRCLPIFTCAFLKLLNTTTPDAGAERGDDRDDDHDFEHREAGRPIAAPAVPLARLLPQFLQIPNHGILLLAPCYWTKFCMSRMGCNTENTMNTTTSAMTTMIIGDRTVVSRATFPSTSRS